jgi:hypothetical protein
LATRKDVYAIPPEDIELLILEIFTDFSPSLMSLTVRPISQVEGDTGEFFPAIDYRYNFMIAMIKYGFLDPGAPSRILGIAQEDIPALAEVKEIVDSANEFGDEEGCITRILERLAEYTGNQNVIAAAILEVPPSS